MTNESKMEILKALLVSFRFEESMEPDINFKRIQVLIENIAILFDETGSEDHEVENTAYQPKNPNESQMERDDASFKRGYETCQKEWEENSPKEYEHGYIKGFSVGQKQGQANMQIMREATFQEGFEKGLASLESESKFKMEIRKRLKQLEDLLVI